MFPFLALLGPREMSDLSPQSGPKRTLSRNRRMTECDPGCVKTHTVAKCRKNNSPGGHHASRVQYDLTLRYAIPSRSFYARSKGWSFYTAKTHFGPGSTVFEIGCASSRSPPGRKVLSLHNREIVL